MALFTLEELASWVQSDLDTATATLARAQATAYLEAETGVKLTQDTTSITYTPRWDDCWIDLPVPTTAVSSVTVDGTALASTDYTKVDNRLYRRAGWGGARWTARESEFSYRTSDDDYVPVVVALTYGFADGSAPDEFKLYGLVVATQVVQLANKVGMQSESIDDYSVTFATGAGAAQGIPGLPAEVLGRLRSRYGRGVSTVAS